MPKVDESFFVRHVQNLIELEQVRKLCLGTMIVKGKKIDLVLYAPGPKVNRIPNHRATKLARMLETIEWSETLNGNAVVAAINDQNFVENLPKVFIERVEAQYV